MLCKFKVLAAFWGEVLVVNTLVRAAFDFAVAAACLALQQGRQMDL